MVYIEQAPHPALAPYIQGFWYAQNPSAQHGFDRVLPAGHMQVVVSLARDYLTDCSEFLAVPNGGGQASPRRSAAAILTGMRSSYDLIDRYDMEELIGVIFSPGGTLAFFPMNADVFTNTETALEDLWGLQAETLRERIRQAPSISTKFDLLGDMFLRKLRERRPREQPPAVSFALAALRPRDRPITILEVGRQTGLSPRRLSELYREQVGVSPKLYQRIVRFQRAVQQMHRAEDVRWMDLALACGYYDQSHFVNDFRKFSGINPTTYSTTQRVFSNHVPFD